MKILSVYFNSWNDVNEFCDEIRYCHAITTIRVNAESSCIIFYWLGRIKGEKKPNYFSFSNFASHLAICFKIYTTGIHVSPYTQHRGFFSCLVKSWKTKTLLWNILTIRYLSCFFRYLKAKNRRIIIFNRVKGRKENPQRI